CGPGACAAGRSYRRRRPWITAARIPFRLGRRGGGVDPRHHAAPVRPGLRRAARAGAGSSASERGPGRAVPRARRLAAAARRTPPSCILEAVSRSAHRHRYTYRDYLAVEEASPVRHEFLDGEIYAMAGGTPEHAALAMNVGSALVTQLRDRPCRVMGSDLRI